MRQLPAADGNPPGFGLTAAIVSLVGLAGLVVALGWAAMGYAIHVGAYDGGAMVALIAGTVLVITGSVLACVPTIQARRSR